MAKKLAPAVALSDQVRAVIAARGLTLSELAEASGVDGTVIGRFVSGEREIRSGTMDKLAGALGLRVVEVEDRRKGKAKR